MFSAVNAAGDRGALKVFEPWSADAKRIERQLELRGHDCKHLVRVFEGGPVSVDGKEHAFLAMEHVEGEDLRALVSHERRPDDPTIRRLLGQLLEASKFLLDRNLCHRDIKPDNIRIRPNGELVLLDIGVIRPFGATGLTDEEARHFVGTRRYAPPEFQHRREEDNATGWTRVTVYQVGAVLYEMIHGAKLFANVAEQPQADLVVAINETVPSVFRSDVADDLLDLCRRCLEKEAVRRPTLDVIERVARAAAPPPRRDDTSRQRIAHANEAYRTRIVAKQEQIAADLERWRVALRTVSEIVATSLKGSDLLPAAADHDGPGPGDWVIRTVTVRENLPGAVVGSVELIVLFEVARPTARVHVRGVGVWGDAHLMNMRKKPQAVLGVQPAPTLIEELWEGPLDPIALRARLDRWVEGMAAKYFEISGAALEARLAEEEQLLERRARTSGPFMTSRFADRPTCFNTSSHALLSTHVP